MSAPRGALSKQKLRELLQAMDRALIVRKPQEWRVTVEQYQALMKEFPDGKFKGIPIVKITEKQ